ncbi:MAG: glycosyltransferase [Bacteroidales bacterium]|nr:glycosyltransferase [Bacteroidales bacterium]
MKILVLAHKPPFPPVDGGTLATLNMCIGLVKAGNTVTVLTLSTPKHPSSIERIPESLLSEINFEILSIPLTTTPFGYFYNILFTRRPYNIQRYFSKTFKRIILKTLRSNEFDIVQLEGLYLYPYVKTIRKHFSGKIVLRAHNVEHHIWETLANEESNKLRAWYFNLLARRIARIERHINSNIDALVAISDPDYKWFTTNGLSKPAVVCPAGYFPPQQPLESTPPDKPSLCYIGALDWMPNIEALMWFIDWVWPRIQSEIPEVEFYVAGRNATSELAERLMMERNIVFYGQVADSATFLSAYPVMIAPLFSGSGIRVKIIEGMFLRRAIVATSMASRGIKAVNNEHLLIADAPDEFAQAVCRLLSSPETASYISKNAQEFAFSHFDATHLAKELTNFYQRLI